LRDDLPYDPNRRCGPIPSLARFDKQTKTFEWVAPREADAPDPATESGRFYRALLVERDVVWLAAERGVFRLDKRTGRWGRIEEASSDAWDPYRIIRTPDGSLYLSGSAVVLRWNRP
jgi:hypothetical protein